MQLRLWLQALSLLPCQMCAEHLSSAQTSEKSQPLPRGNARPDALRLENPSSKEIKGTRTISGTWPIRSKHGGKSPLFLPEGLPVALAAGQVGTTFDKGHGRLEKRTLRTTTLRTKHQDWAGLKQGYELVRERTEQGNKTVDGVHGITSLSPQRPMRSGCSN